MDFMDRTDWTPEEALRFYAEQKNFDIVDGHARILDNGAIASNALKHASLSYLAMKGDVALHELEAENARLKEQLAAAQLDAARLDFLDGNTRFKMGWRVGVAPVGNLNVSSVIQLSGEPTSIREAIDAAIGEKK